MEPHHRDRQAVNDATILSRNVQPRKHHFSHQVEPFHQLSASAVETTLRREMGEQVRVITPLGQQFSLYRPTSTFTDYSHRKQFLVRAQRSRSRSGKKVFHLLPGIVHYAVHPQTKVVKTGDLSYHTTTLRCAVCGSRHPLTYHIGGVSVNRSYLA